MSELDEHCTLNHVELVESINRRVDIIYKQLCEYEESLDTRNVELTSDNQTKIMNLLESLEIIQEAAQVIRPYNLNVHSVQQSLDEQIKCLDQSLDLLKLECVKK